MELQDLNNFLEENKNYEWQIETEEETDNKKPGKAIAILLRNVRLPWYEENTNHCTRITMEKLKELDIEGLKTAINKGVDIIGISRITGYFSKISNWNEGKKGELKDRHRNTIE
jgi:anaerobic ribonucleoside-triphosphate reductase